MFLFKKQNVGAKWIHLACIWFFCVDFGSKMNTPCLYPKTLLILIVCSWFPRSRFQPVCRPPQHVFPWAVVPTAEGAVPKYSSRQHWFYCQNLHVARRAGWSVWWPPVFIILHSWSRRMLIPSVKEDCAHWHCIHRCKAVLIFNQNVECLPSSCHRDHRFSSEVDFFLTAHVRSYNILKMTWMRIWYWKERSSVLLLHKRLIMPLQWSWWRAVPESAAYNFNS